VIPNAGGGAGKSERSHADSMAPMGYGATRTLERVAAAMGTIAEARVVFESARDIPQGGVLLALPALLSVGLLRHSQELYSLPAGFYSISSVFLLLALMALARIPSLEQLRYVPAGEWGNLLGLDRIPEVRTLREKLNVLCAEAGRAARWNAALAREWIARQEQDSDSGGLAFYVDGHVRVYHGKKTKLPRHYVARERFYQRATVDYWVNALDGQPFFYINKAVDHGLIEALRTDILPWLRQVPISARRRKRMAANKRVPRFTVIFDREGYSPELFRSLQQERIAALTYHRYPKEDWPAEEFRERTVKLANGETVKINLAERKTRVGNRHSLLVREIRKLAPDGRQVAVVSTNRMGSGAAQVAALMARWSQENFFKYMREHFGLDALVQYGTEEIPETVTVLNPAWRELNRQVRSLHAEWKHCRRQQGEIALIQPISETVIRQYEHIQGQLQEKVEQIERSLQELKNQRTATPHHIPVKDLPEKDRFQQLRPERKQFLDTVKMIAYRAETAMAATIREKLARFDDARALLRQIYQTEVDLIADLNEKTLTVRLHHLTQAAHDGAVQHLCEELTATETTFPGTDLRLVYRIGST
jgi:hypothetical protein